MGAIRGSDAGFLSKVTSAAQAEVHACGEAMRAVADWGMGRIILESDAQNVIAALNGNDYDLAPEGILYRDARVFARLNFISVEFLFCPRVCNNNVAHELASSGLGEKDARSVWPEAIPNCIRSRLASASTVPIK